MKLVSTDQPGYLLDRDTGVVINNNDKDLHNYRKQVEQFIQFRDLKDDFDDVRRELLELRRLLAKN